MNEIHETYFESPIGFLKIQGSDAGVQSIAFTNLETPPHRELPGCLAKCCDQLFEYFEKTRTEFDLALRPAGTGFQQSVWRELQKIPFGRTTTYIQIARSLNNEKAVRAVGAANGQNPIPIIIPCHRVIGSNGALIGFGGGIWRKEFLLKHEQVFLV